MTDRFAPEGAVWVCGACGKTHKDLYGLEGEGTYGWDESCALNVVLCHEKQHTDGRGCIVWIPFDQPIPVDPRPL